MILTPHDVEDIVKLLDSTDYDELELETDRFVLRLRRTPGGWTEEREALGEPRVVRDREREERGGPDTAGERTQRTEPTEPTEPTERTQLRHHEHEGLHAVRAPLPGVFYRAPKPGEPPFVEIGDHVEPDTIVAILETMKLMNPVRAGTSGTVTEFAVANNEPAEKDAVLVWVAPLTP